MPSPATSGSMKRSVDDGLMRKWRQNGLAFIRQPTRFCTTGKLIADRTFDGWTAITSFSRLKCNVTPCGFPRAWYAFWLK